MRSLDEIPTPALLLDLDVLEANLEAMARRAGSLGVALRPHLKTHKCVEVARLQRDLGARGATVATLHEARVFAEHGFDDLTWAFPVVPGRVEEAAELAGEVTLRLVVESHEALDLLEETGRPLHVWMEVDCGYGRTGVEPGGSSARELARRISDAPQLRFDGILTHGGQAYHGDSPADIARAAEQERSVMVDLAGRLRDEGIPVPGISVGSTPGMARARSLDGVTEARPGNYAFYDYTQVQLGSCGPEDCALTVLSTVVSSPPGSDRSTCDAGALSLSKDPGPDAGPATMGEIYRDYAAGELREDVRLVSLSQEHGRLDGRLPLGERIRILPNHSCLAAACFDRYHAVRGDRVVDRWTIHRGRS
jgi:D-serine deaminase-like pyridoxal phosphate-dependent protein